MELYNINKNAHRPFVMLCSMGIFVDVLLMFSRNTVTSVIEPSIAHALHNLYENFEIYA